MLNFEKFVRKGRSLLKVIWEEGRVAALSHMYAVKSPNLPPKIPLPMNRSPLPASYLNLSDLRCQTASRSYPPFFHNALDRQTDRLMHGESFLCYLCHVRSLDNACNQYFIYSAAGEVSYQRWGYACIQGHFQGLSMGTKHPLGIVFNTKLPSVINLELRPLVWLPHVF